MMYQIGVDLGFLPEPVTVGPVGSGAQMSSITLSGAERADVVIDFSEHAGETITVTNDAEFPYIGENLGATHGDNGHFAALDEILQFQVKDVDPPADDSADPSTLDLPAGPEFKEAAARETRQMTLDSRGVDGLDTHLLNNSHWGDESAVVRCQRGATEIWELKNNTPDSHPIHLHLVEFQVLDRIDHATGKSAPPDPNERGDKDTVRVNPDETVRIITRIGDFTGRYVWHCHILEHEDQEMMLPFEVVNGPPDK
jgi:spore coat protein A